MAVKPLNASRRTGACRASARAGTLPGGGARMNPARDKFKNPNRPPAAPIEWTLNITLCYVQRPTELSPVAHNRCYVKCLPARNAYVLSPTGGRTKRGGEAGGGCMRTYRYGVMYALCWRVMRADNCRVYGRRCAQRAHGRWVWMSHTSLNGRRQPVVQCGMAKFPHLFIGSILYFR